MRIDKDGGRVPEIVENETEKDYIGTERAYNCFFSLSFFQNYIYESI